MTSREKAQATMRKAHFKAGDPLGSLWDAVSDIYESRGTCATCAYTDHHMQGNQRIHVAP